MLSLVGGVSQAEKYGRGSESVHPREALINFFVPLFFVATLFYLFDRPIAPLVVVLSVAVEGVSPTSSMPSGTFSTSLSKSYA